MIGIIDYGMGNLFNVQHALKELGYESCFLNQASQFDACDALILPGVGAFKDAMDNLRRLDLVQAIKESRLPLLGICLGMQLLFESSTEVELCEGLKLLPGHFERFDSNLVRVPHMGWNELEMEEQRLMVYYVHSYYLKDCPTSIIRATSQYGPYQVAGLVGQGRVWGMQFHPEKSSQDGLALLRRWLDDFVSCH